MQFWRLFVILSAAVSVVLGGCAFGRDEITLAAAPVSAHPPAASKGRSVFVRTVTDERVFSTTGDDPAMPSLEADGDKAEIKARAVARKRNGYQMALGDVLLEPGQTVAGRVGDTLREAFQLSGYTVVKEAGGVPAPIVVDARVKKFWTWRRKGFTAITVLADIDAELTIAGAKSPPGHIAVHIEDDVLMAGPGTTIETLQKGLTGFRAEAITKIAGMKF